MTSYGGVAYPREKKTQPKQKPKAEPKPRVKKVLPKPKAAPEPPKLPPEGPAVPEVLAPPTVAEAAVPAVDVKEESEEIEEQMVAAALRESRDSPPPSPEKTLELMQAEYDSLPDLEEYTPEMAGVAARHRGHAL